MVPRGDPAASRDAGARGVQRDVASGIALGAVVIIFLFVCVMQCARSWWREERRRRAREAHENNPWTRMEAARGHHHPDEGSGKPESSAGGSVVRGFMYGLYVINPTGSFSFGSVGVETNEREVRARREATAAAAAAAAEAAAAGEEARRIVPEEPSSGSDEVPEQRLWHLLRAGKSRNCMRVYTSWEEWTDMVLRECSVRKRRPQPDEPDNIQTAALYWIPRFAAIGHF